jgi:hypothetical protein
MASSGLYLGNVSDLASNMTSMLGTGTQGNNSWPVPSPIKPIQGPFPDQRQPSQPQQPVTGSVPNNPTGGGMQAGGNFSNSSYNPLAAQAVRPTSFGSMDPSYGQNLATSIGSAFQRPQSGMPLQFNPYGNLTDANVPYPNAGGGNAPLPGLPQTLLQWAQMFNPTALNPTTSGTTGG